MNIEAMTEIILGAQNFADNANVDKESLSALFQTFDTDDNGLIDTLEFLAALALVSGLFDSVDFFFSVYRTSFAAGALAINVAY